MLVFSSALSELTWPTILSKRQSFRLVPAIEMEVSPDRSGSDVPSCIFFFFFREVFMDFNPDAVAKLNEKKFIAPGSTASFLLSEPKLRAVIENSRQILKVDLYYVFLSFLLIIIFFSSIDSPSILFLDIYSLGPL